MSGLCLKTTEIRRFLSIIETLASVFRSTNIVIEEQFQVLYTMHMYDNETIAGTQNKIHSEMCAS